MGDKIFINFLKYSYEECIKRLKHEVNSHLPKENQHIEPTVVNLHSTQTHLPASISKNPSVLSSERLTEAQVGELFISNNIDNDIVSYLSPCEGLVLKQLYDMKKNDLPFYNQSIKSISDNINLKSILKFSTFLDKIFSNNNDSF
jgi:hypothetical protein